MEKICFFIIMTVSISQVKAKKDEKMCEIETNVIPSDVNNYSQMKLPETREGKCYGACVMKSMLIIDSRGKINPRRAEQMAHTYIKSREQLERVENEITKCSQPANHLNDECETAYYFMKCLAAKSSAKMAKSGRFVTFSPPTISVNLPPVTFVLFQISAL